MAISKNIELKIKTVDETKSGTQQVNASLKKIEASAKQMNIAGQQNTKWSSQLNNSISQTTISYDRLNFKIRDTNKYGLETQKWSGNLSGNINKLVGSYEALNTKARQYESTLRQASQLEGKIGTGNKFDPRLAGGFENAAFAGGFAGQSGFGGGTTLAAAELALFSGLRGGHREEGRIITKTQRDKRRNALQQKIGPFAFDGEIGRVRLLTEAEAKINNLPMGDSTLSESERQAELDSYMGTIRKESPNINDRSPTKSKINKSIQNKLLKERLENRKLDSQISEMIGGPSKLDSQISEMIGEPNSTSPKKRFSSIKYIKPLVPVKALDSVKPVYPFASATSFDQAKTIDSVKKLDSQMSNSKGVLASFRKEADNSIKSMLKLGVAVGTAGLVVKGAEIGFKGVSLFLTSLDDDADKTAAGFIELGKAIESTPLVGGLIKSSGILDSIFQFEKIQQAEKQVTEEYEKRLSIAKQIQATLKIEADQFRNDRISNLSNSSKGLVLDLSSNNDQVEKLNLDLRAAQNTVDDAEAAKKNISKEILAKPFDDYAGVRFATGETNLEVFIRKNKHDEELMKDLENKTLSDIRRGNISDRLSQSLTYEFGNSEQLIRYEGEQRNIGASVAEVKSLQEAKTEREGRSTFITQQFDDEGKKAIAEQEKALGLSIKDLSNQEKVARLRQQGKDLEADKLQIDIQLGQSLQSNKESQEAAVEFIQDRNKALKEAGLPLVDEEMALKDINKLYDEQNKKIKEISAERKLQLQIAENERRLVERQALERKVFNDSSNSKVSFASSVLQDRANAGGDLDAAKALREIAFSRERKGLQDQLKTAIKGQSALGTFSSANNAIELSKLFSETLAFKFVDQEKIGDTRLPSLTPRQELTGVRESFTESIDGLRRSAQLSAMKNISMNTEKINKTLKDMAIQSIIFNEQ